MGLKQLPKKIKQTARTAWHDWQDEQLKKRNIHLRKALSENELKILESLEDNGFAMITNFWTREEALDIKHKLNEHLANGQDTDFDCGAYSRFGVSGHQYGVGIQRLYHADRILPQLHPYRFDSMALRIISAYYGKPFHSSLLLFQHNPKGTVDGRYHVDGFKKEFKTFIYLDDVTLDNGPFTYMRGSHKRHFRRIKRQLQGIRNGSNTNFWDEDLVDLLQDEVKITAPAGTMLLADVRGFHFGSPQLTESRSVLVNYIMSEPGDLQLGR